MKSSRAVFRKKFSENMQQIYRRTPMLNCDFSKVALQYLILLLHCNFMEITFRHEYSPVNLLHFFRTPFPKNTSGGLLLSLVCDGFLSVKNFFRRYVSILLLPSKARILNSVMLSSEARILNCVKAI